MPSIGSDHFPLFTRLSFTSSHGVNQQGLQAETTDKQWSKEISGKENVSKNDVPTPAIES